MPLVVPNYLSVGPYPLPLTLEYIAGRGLDAIAAPWGAVELRPNWKDFSIPGRSTEALQKGIQEASLAAEDDFLRTYEDFSLPITVVVNPDEPLEKLSKVSMVPLPPLTGGLPFSCMVEDPNSTTDAFRTFSEEDAKALVVEARDEWTPGNLDEPYIKFADPFGTNPSQEALADFGPGGFGFEITANLEGYFTEKNFYDREWILRYPDAVARFNTDGIKYIRYEDIPQGVAFDVDIIKKELTGSPLNYNSFYPQTALDAEILEAPYMDSFIRRAEGVLSYKSSEIRKMRFFFWLRIESYIVHPFFISPQTNTPFNLFQRDTTIPLQLELMPTIYTPILCHMTVNLDSDFNQGRFDYALENVNTVPTNLLPPKPDDQSNTSTSSTN